MKPMGVDKDATDIWLFGRARPDLTIEQTIEEAKKRRVAIDDHAKERARELLDAVRSGRTDISGGR
jgi:hypothetical protein